jgi:hypothetical protein
VTDSAEPASSEAATAGEQPVATSSGAASWTPSAPESAASVADEHPELIVGAAFAGGLLLATILKRLAA